MKVFRICSVSDGEIAQEGRWPKRCDFKLGDLIGSWTKVPDVGWRSGPEWRFALDLGPECHYQTIVCQFSGFVTENEYSLSRKTPLSFSDLEGFRGLEEGANLACFWFFRDGIYVTESHPRRSQWNEIELRIKALHFRREDFLRRLKHEVEFFEKMETKQIAKEDDSN